MKLHLYVYGFSRQTASFRAHIFTNLSENKFSTQDIINLYLQRWDIECSYKTLKTDYEWERFNSEDCDWEMCCIYAKIIFHSLIGIIRKN